MPPPFDETCHLPPDAGNVLDVRIEAAELVLSCSSSPPSTWIVALAREKSTRILINGPSIKVGGRKQLIVASTPGLSLALYRVASDACSQPEQLFAGGLQRAERCIA